VLFFNLKVIENHFSPEKLEFFVQLLIEELTLDVLKNLLFCRKEKYTINNLLKIKVLKSKLFNSFNNSDLFSNKFNSTFIINTNNRPNLTASAFTTNNKIAV
jgi:hypothetical protein